MMSPEYFTVAGYITDGAIVCRECGDKAGLPSKDQITEAQAYQDFSEGGLYCDTCMKEIVEPYIPECAECGVPLILDESGMCEACQEDLEAYLEEENKQIKEE